MAGYNQIGAIVATSDAKMNQGFSEPTDFRDIDWAFTLLAGAEYSSETASELIKSG